MITEDYVSYETAKLLKENLFDEKCHMCWDEVTKTMEIADEYATNSELLATYISAPTLQMTMKWLREVHNINISVVPHSYKEGKPFDYEFVYWNGVKYHTPYDEKHPIYHELFGRTWKKYEEACEAGIRYCLENLIFRYE